jgi:hypothetical protein
VWSVLVKGSGITVPAKFISGTREVIYFFGELVSENEKFLLLGMSQFQKTR